jgi:stage IV sporulation protein FB
MEPRTERRSGWSVTLGTVIGIPIRVHATFLILLVWFGYHSSQVGHRIELAIVFLLGLFGCVVLHELGHAAMGRSYGVRTREIVLYPFGGIARLEEIPGGRAELMIALAGPAVNLALAAAIETTMLIGGVRPDLPVRLQAPPDVLQYLLFVNLMLFLFNLLPAFPMDGGRVLRAALTLAMPPVRATEIAATVGRVLAVLLAAGGLLLSNPFLIVVALFVYLGAAQEAAYFRQHAALEGKVAGDAMITGFETLAPQESLREVWQRGSTTAQRDFPVIDLWGRVVGVLSRGRLMHSLSEQGGDGLVLEAMDRDMRFVEPGDDLRAILRELRTRPGSPLLVMRDGKLLGMITLERLAEVIELSRRTATGDGRA